MPEFQLADCALFNPSLRNELNLQIEPPFLFERMSSRLVLACFEVSRLEVARLEVARLEVARLEVARLEVARLMGDAKIMTQRL